MDRTKLRLLVQGVAAAIKGLRLYPLQHPALDRQVHTLHRALLDGQGGRPLRLGLLEGTLFVQDYLFAEDFPPAEDVGQALQERHLEGVEFLPGLTIEELRSFLAVLTEGDLSGRELFERLAAQGGTHIRPLGSQAEEEREGKPRLVYGRALKVAAHLFDDVRLGRVPSSTEARQVVGNMVRLTLADPQTLFALSMLKDYDNYTFMHSVNVAVISLVAGRACAVSEEELRALGLGGLLHDLGKLKIAPEIITKPGRLTEAEFEAIKNHPRTGADIVQQMEGVTPEVIDIVLCHHLHYDQAGYPADMRGRQISPLAEITALADTYDAMTTLRSYQRPMTPRRATLQLRKLAGTILHPLYTEQFIAALGPYPVGSLVRLDSNEIGLVMRVGSTDPEAVQLKMLFDGEGNKLVSPPTRELSGAQAGCIVAEVDPLVKGIEVTNYLT